MKILAIESSCDETSAAVISEENNRPVLLSNVVSSQVDIHAEYGGVVPEVAARAHVENILPVIKKALRDAKIKLSDIDYLAPTYGPGLVGSLLVGVETAKALGISKNIPIIPVNHLEGHLYANFFEEEPQFPLLALVISGGHTMLILMRGHLDYEIIGKTRDDAAGEAFDKVAKLMGLGYPGGPIISDLAEKGDENHYDLPLIDLTEKPFRNENSFLEYPKQSMDFSFSGLKTAVLNKVKKEDLTDKKVNDLAASFQKSVGDNLIQNIERAINAHQPRTFVLSGGVAANKYLRERIKNTLPKKIKYLVPPFSLCTDNAAMIGIAGYYHIKKSPQGTLDFVSIPNLKIS